MTEQLVSLIRQQRHLATRVVIATQEPTLSPQLIDLCNVTIVHRFNSPAWFTILEKHLAGASNIHDANNPDVKQLFEMIVALRPGEAFVFCPTALLDVDDGNLLQLQNGFIRVKIRARCSADGGRSIMASDLRSVSSVDSRPVANKIHPWRSSYSATTAPGFQGRRSASPINPPTAPRSMQPASMVQTVPPTNQTPAPYATLGAGVQAITAPAGTSTTIQQRQVPLSQAQVVEVVRAVAANMLQTSPNIFQYEIVRARVAESLRFPSNFFKDVYWLKVSRETIRKEVVSLLC